MKVYCLVLVAIFYMASISSLAQQESSSRSSAAPAGERRNDTIHLAGSKNLVFLSDSVLRPSLTARETSTLSTQASTTGLPTIWFGGGTIVGTLPTDPSITVIPVDIVPVVLHITQGGVFYSFDPTQADSGCLPPSSTALSLFNDSPFFHALHISMNGVDEGVTQYLDAFQRGELAYADPNHRTYLSQKFLPALTLTLSVPEGGASGLATVRNVLGQCGSSGSTNPQNKQALIDSQTLDSLVRNYMSAHGIPASELAFFLLYNSAISTPGTCCVFGYHGSTDGTISLPGHTYVVADFEGRNETIGRGLADVSIITHELAEWANDPSGQNPASWGNIGQEVGCQNTLEVGDPLTGTLAPSIALDGFTYHFQELAFLSWFVGDSPSQGIGGKYSSNGTFSGYAQPCPPGGTF